MLHRQYPDRDHRILSLSEDIKVEGFSSLATGAILENADVNALAHRCGVTVAQVCIHYVLQEDVVTLPKSRTPSRIIANLKVEFAISKADMVRLNGLKDTVPVHFDQKILAGRSA